MTIKQDLLTPNKYSRPGTVLTRHEKTAVHYTADPGATAQNIRDYFESLKSVKARTTDKGTIFTYASSHYVIGLDGEVIQCVPDMEIAYTTNSANVYSLSIEVCHPDSTGKFNDVTYMSLVELCTLLCMRYKLTPTEDLIRHYDITRKLCPLWFVNYPAEWTLFKQRVQALKDEKEGMDMETAPQWKIDAVSWLKTEGIISSDHDPLETIDMGTLGVMLKNFATKFNLTK